MPASEKKLSRAKKQFIVLLGLPSFGLALSSTIIVTYTPIIAKQFTKSNLVIGAIIATEGLVAFFLPVLAGTWSDHVKTRFGGRLPFLMTGLPIMAIVMCFVGFSNSLWSLIVLLFLFFLAYYLAYEPYRALYPDLINNSEVGRAQSLQAVWRGIGTGIALTVGGFLFASSKFLPYIMAAFFVLLSASIFVWALLSRNGKPKQKHKKAESIKEIFISSIELIKTKPKLRAFLISNMLWELTLAALKSFILLFITAGLGKSKTTAAVYISITACVMFIAAPFGGKLGDKYGTVRIARIAALVFGLGLLVPAFLTKVYFLIPILPFVAFGGAIVLTLPYAIMIPLMPEAEHGKLTGLYSSSRGIGIMLGPLLAGAAITFSKNLLPANGYSAMWLVCGVAMLLSTLPLKFKVRES